MTNAKFCDRHKEQNNLVKKENTGRVKYSLYDESRKTYRHLDADLCIPDMKEDLELIKSHGNDIESMWYYDVLIPPNTGDFNRSDKRWIRAKLSPEEFDELRDLQDDMRDSKDDDEEDDKDEKFTGKHKKKSRR